MKYLVTGYDTSSAISEEIDGRLEIEDYMIIFYKNDIKIAVFTTNDVWVRSK